MSEVSCENCVGACCSNVRLALSVAEARHLEAAGTKLHMILTAFDALGFDTEVADEDAFYWSENIGLITAVADRSTSEAAREFWNKVADQARRLKADQGLFSIEGRCGFLQADGRCGDYKNRPEVCREFPVGGTACLGIRKDAGIPVPIEISQAPIRE